jgi:uncharacterized repeat protein (TIGR03803 family)
MRIAIRPRLLRYAFFVATLALSLALYARAQTFSTLASFNGDNGNDPERVSLVQATDGNFYGATFLGGYYEGGNVFQVTPAGKLTSLYNFCTQKSCFSSFGGPEAGLVLGADGELYGTTYGGNDSGGTVYKMSIRGNLTTLHNFCQTNCADGLFPYAPLVQASNGSFYGTTYTGGSYFGGVVFQITSTGEFATLYSFCAIADCVDGLYPISGLMQASNGNLYGTTPDGGVYGKGVVYEITPAGGFKTLYSFCAKVNCADGSYPYAGLVQASDGSFYGTTEAGGTFNYGTVFRITPTGELGVLHSFRGTDGANPFSAPIQASDGNFYGLTSDYDYSGYPFYGGTIYELTSAGEFTSLYTFCDAEICTGDAPHGGLVQGTDGILYGLTDGGGAFVIDGTAFSYSLNLPPFVGTVPAAGKAGTRVIILGNNLMGSTSVTFNGTPAAFTVVSETEITASVPAAATTGAVQVVTQSGVLNSNPAFQVLQ